MSSRFAIDTLQLHSTSMSALTLRGVGTASHKLSRETVGPGSGNTYDEARFITTVEDEFEFGGVLALKSLLDNVSLLTGKCVDDDGSHPGLRLFGQLLSRCGTKGRGAAGTAAQVTAKLAHLLVTQLGGTKNQLATATLRGVNLLKSGETTPSVTVFNATLPSSPVVEEAFKIGPVSVAGEVLDPDGIKSVQIDTGIQVEVVQNVEGYAATLLVLKVAPRIRIESEDGALLDAGAVPYAGIAAAHADTYVSFIALDPAGGNKALAGSHHVKVTANGKAYIEEHLNGGGPATASTSIVIECTETSGGVAPLVVTTGVALA